MKAFTAPQAQNWVSPYAMTLFKGQISQASYYKVAETPAGSGSYSVSRKDFGSGSSPPAFTDDGLTAAEDAGVGLDSGLGLEAKPRTTTVSRCSCQFCVFAGLPCRHQLAVIITQQSELPPSLFHKRWLLPSKAEVAANTADLFRRPPPLRLAAGAGPGHTRDDRFQLCMAAFKAVADVAATSDKLTEECIEASSALLAKLSGSRGRGGPGRGSGGSDASRRRVVQLDGGGAADPEGASSGDNLQHRSEALCHGCWQPGHRRDSRLCSRWDAASKSFLPPLKRPSKRKGGILSGAAQLRKKRANMSGLLDNIEEEEEGAGEGAEGAEGTDGGAGEVPEAAPAQGGRTDEMEEAELVCLGCGELSSPPRLLCDADECSRLWHAGCLPRGAGHSEGDLWFCSFCTDHAVDQPIGNPQRPPPGRGGQRQRRFKSAIEPTPTARRLRRKQQQAARGQHGTPP